MAKDVIESEKINGVNNKSKTEKRNEKKVEKSVQEQLKTLEEFATITTEKIKTLEAQMKLMNQEVEYAIDKIYEIRDSAIFR